MEPCVALTIPRVSCAVASRVNVPSQIHGSGLDSAVPPQAVTSQATEGDGREHIFGGLRIRGNQQASSTLPADATAEPTPTRAASALSAIRPLSLARPRRWSRP